MSVKLDTVVKRSLHYWQCPHCKRNSFFKHTIVSHMSSVHPEFDQIEPTRHLRPKIRQITDLKLRQCFVKVFDINGKENFTALKDTSAANSLNIEDYSLSDVKFPISDIQTSIKSNIAIPNTDSSEERSDIICAELPNIDDVLVCKGMVKKNPVINPNPVCFDFRFECCKCQDAFDHLTEAKQHVLRKHSADSQDGHKFIMIIDRLSRIKFAKYRIFLCPKEDCVFFAKLWNLYLNHKHCSKDWKLVWRIQQNKKQNENNLYVVSMTKNETVLNDCASRVIKTEKDSETNFIPNTIDKVEGESWSIFAQSVQHIKSPGEFSKQMLPSDGESLKADDYFVVTAESVECSEASDSELPNATACDSESEAPNLNDTNMETQKSDVSGNEIPGEREINTETGHNSNANEIEAPHFSEINVEKQKSDVSGTEDPDQKEINAETGNNSNENESIDQREKINVESQKSGVGGSEVTDQRDISTETGHNSNVNENESLDQSEKINVETGYDSSVSRNEVPDQGEVNLETHDKSQDSSVSRNASPYIIKPNQNEILSHHESDVAQSVNQREGSVETLGIAQDISENELLDENGVGTEACSASVDDIGQTENDRETSPAPEAIESRSKCDEENDIFDKSKDLELFENDIAEMEADLPDIIVPNQNESVSDRESGVALLANIVDNIEPHSDKTHTVNSTDTDKSNNLVDAVNSISFSSSSSTGDATREMLSQLNDQLNEANDNKNENEANDNKNEEENNEDIVPDSENSLSDCSYDLPTIMTRSELANTDEQFHNLKLFDEATVSAKQTSETSKTTDTPQLDQTKKGITVEEEAICDKLVQYMAAASNR